MAVSASCVVVVKQAFSLADIFDGVEDHGWYASGQLPHSAYVRLARRLTVVYPVDEPSHVRVLLRPDDECLIRIEATPEFHDAVVLTRALQLDTLAQSHYFSDVLADQRLFFDVPVGHHVVPHSLLVDEVKRTHWLLLVVSIDLVLFEGHVVQPEVETVLCIDF